MSHWYEFGGQVQGPGGFGPNPYGAGGGYGPPEERPREAIQRDIESGFVSEEAAIRDYGAAAIKGAGE